jgi:hypothetical protein
MAYVPISQDGMNRFRNKALLDPSLLRTSAGQAAAAQLWADEGWTQKKIARAFGLKGSTAICIAISRLIQNYCPEQCAKWHPHSAEAAPRVYGEGRKPLAREAVDRHLKARDGRDPAGEKRYLGAAVLVFKRPT